MFLDKYIDGGWTLAIRPRQHGHELFLGDNKQLFRLIRNPWRYWCADPFLINIQGTEYIFCEAFDILRDRGIIGYRTISPDGKVSKLHPCLRTDFHLSYPNIFEYDGQIYMIPESASADQIQVYKALDFPDKWEKHGVLVDSVAACDTNILKYQGNWYLFTLIYDKTQEHYVYDKLYAYTWDKSSFSRSHDMPVVEGAHKARNAGKFFFNQHDLYRVSQDCGKMYGEKIAFHRVMHLEPGRYEEQPVQSIGVHDIMLDRKNHFDGIHTYNMDEYYEIVDLQRKKWFRPERMIYLVCNKIRSIFIRIIGR